MNKYLEITFKAGMATLITGAFILVASIIFFGIGFLFWLIPDGYHGAIPLALVTITIWLGAYWVITTEREDARRRETHNEDNS
jgi:membrane protein implicated in regulation of membrane protease activity